MRRFLMLLTVIVASGYFVSLAVAAEKAPVKTGKELFKAHCAVCHPDGGNIINPQKTLHKKDREANSIRKPGDIIMKMRNPGVGMTKFDETTISDKDAGKIAEYILKNIK